MTGSEVTNITEMISEGRHLAIKQLEEEAVQENAHGLTGVKSELKTLSGLTEFLALWSAVRGQNYTGPFFSIACSGQELYWQLDAGYMPLRLVLSTSVYVLGFAGGIMAMFNSMSRGEVYAVTQLVYEAWENCLTHIRNEEEHLQADRVIGIKVFVYEISRGLVEVMAIGSAIRRNTEVTAYSDRLIPQAIIRDRDTFFDDAGPTSAGVAKERSLGQKGGA